MNFYGSEFNQLLIPNPKLLLRNDEEPGQAFEKLSLTQIGVLSNELIKPERITVDDLVRISLNIPKNLWSDLWSEMCETFLDLISKRTSKEQNI